MGGLFGGSKAPAPQPIPEPPKPIPVPTVDEAKDTLDNADKLRRRRGQASTILAGKSDTGSGDLAAPPVMAGAKLLGQ